MNSRTCLVTGATSGIGFENARAIAAEGARLVIVGRGREKSEAAAERIRRDSGNPNVDVLLADLSSQAEIRRLAADVMQRYQRLHVLVNNVGGMFLNGQDSPDGIEMTVALNHLGPFLLTRLLLPLLTASAPARIVNVSSMAHLGARIDFATFPGRQFSGWAGYKRSKLANILFTYELSRRLESTGVTVNALHPGLVASGFGMNNRGLFPLVKPLVDLFAVSVEAGALTSTYLACAPEVEGVTGQYFVRCKPRRSSRASYDRLAAATLWDASSAATGLAAG